MSYTEPQIDPREALAHLRTLLRAASDVDDIETVQRIIKEMLAIVDKALHPHRRK